MTTRPVGDETLLADLKATPELVVQSGHAGNITGVVFSPDGRLAATASADQTVKLWDLRVGLELRTLSGHAGPVYAIGFSPDGHELVTTSYDRTLRTWDVATGQELSRWVVDPSQAVRPSSLQVGAGLLAAEAGAGSKRTANVYDFRRRERIFSVPAEQGNSPVLSPDGEVVYVLDSFGHALRSWEVRSGRARAPIALEPLNDPNYANALAFSPDGRLLFVTGTGHWAMYDRATGERLWVRHPEAGQHTFWSPTFRDGGIVAVSGPEAVELLDARTGESRLRVAHTGGTAFSPDGRILATTGDHRNWTVRLWNAETGREFRSLATYQKVLGGFVGNRGTRHYVDCSTRSPHLVSASRIEGLTRIWDLSRVGPPIEIETPGVHAIAVHPEREEVAVGYAGGVGIFDLRRGQRLRTAATGPVSALAFNRAGKLLAAGRHDGSVAFVDYEAGAVVTSRPLVQGQVVGLGFSNDTAFLVGSSDFEMVELSLVTETTRSIPLQFVNAITFNPSNPDMALAFGPNKWIAGANAELVPEDNYKILLVNGAGKLQELTGHQQTPQSIDFSPDGRVLASGGSDGTVRLWDPVANTALATLTGHRSDVDQVAFCGGDRLASSSADGTLKLWSVSRRTLEATLVAIGEGNYVIATPDNAYTASRGGLEVIAFRVGQRVVPYAQFDLRLNRPDKVLEGLGQTSGALIEGYRRAWEQRVRKMGFTPEQLQQGLALPEARIRTEGLPSHTEQRTWTLAVEAWDQTAALDRVNVYVNGVPIYGRAGIPVGGASRWEGTAEVSLGQGRNRVEVSALNVRGIESLRDTLEIVYQGPSTPPTLYLLSIGVSAYANPDYSLRYAAKDARDLAALYRDGQSGFAEVKVQSVLDAEATRENILGARAFLEQAGIDDQVVIFLAGHGFLDGQRDYWFGTTDVDPEEPGARGLSFEAIEGLLDGLGARRRLLLMDTCHSGEVEEDAVTPMSVPGGQVTGRGFVRKTASMGTRAEATAGDARLIQSELFADLRRGAGATVISSASGLEFALESASWNNGVFTFALIDGLRTWSADGDQSRSVEVSELRRYVAGRVSELTGGRQNPTFRRENLEDDFTVFGRSSAEAEATRALPALSAPPVVIAVQGVVEAEEPEVDEGGGVSIAFKPHVGFLMAGTTLSEVSCTSDPEVPCPDDETIATRDASGLAVGGDLTLGLGRHVRLGVGSRYTLESGVEAAEHEVLGNDLSVEGIFELVLPVTSWLGVDLRASGGLFTVFPGGALQEGIDGLWERCDSLDSDAIQCEVRGGPFYGFTGSGGMALELHLAFLHLRPELVYQVYRVDLQGLSASGESSIETQVSHTGDRLWLVLGLQLGD